MLLSSITCWRQRHPLRISSLLTSELYNRFLYITVCECVAVRIGALGKASWLGYAEMFKMVFYGIQDFTTSKLLNKSRLPLQGYDVQWQGT